MKKDQERAEKRRGNGNMPFRFWQKKGEDCEVIILDDSLEETFWRHEHNLKIDGKWGNHEPCIQESGPCPHCNNDSLPALVVFLTVLVMRPYTSKKTGNVKEYSKMLLALKRGQYAEFEKIEKIAKKKHGTLRGVSLILERKNEENSFGTGMPVPNEDGQMINDFLTEDDLIAEFGHEAVEGRESGSIIKQKNEDIKVFNYRSIFPEPDADAIRDAHDIEVSGSRRSSQRARHDDADDDDDIPMDDAPAGGSARTRTRRRTQPATSKADDVDDDDDEPEFED